LFIGKHNMAIENERKLLLDTSRAQELLADFKKKKVELSANFYDITQSYLSGSARIRHVVPHSQAPEQHIFTYKTKVAGSTVEIETEISTHDYHKLFLVAKPVVLKTRVKFFQEAYTWDIDFFKQPKNGSVYLAMAEAEMPEFETETPDIHPVLEPYALRWIDVGDKRFNNKNLANIKKTQVSVRDLLKNEKP